MEDHVELEIKSLLRETILTKIDRYDPETNHRPFYSAIFSEEDIIRASVLQSIYTTFGMSVWEDIAVILASGAGFEAEKQYDLRGELDDHIEHGITIMHKELKMGARPPDYSSEFEELRKLVVPIDNPSGNHPDRRVDVYIRKPSGVEHLFDITTVKPNKKEFQTLKKKLLTWMALRLSEVPDAEVIPAVAIPYNPYYPEEYSRWTKEALYDSNQLLVGEEFWNFCAGERVYSDLIEIFCEVGDEVEDEIMTLVA